MRALIQQQTAARQQQMCRQLPAKIPIQTPQQPPPPKNSGHPTPKPNQPKFSVQDTVDEEEEEKVMPTKAKHPIPSMLGKRQHPAGEGGSKFKLEEGSCSSGDTAQKPTSSTLPMASPFKSLKGLKIEFVHKPGISSNSGLQIDPDLSMILHPHFCGYICGKPGSGKTFIMEELVLNPKFYGSKFDQIYVFSPYELPTIECEENVNYFKSLNLEIVQKIIDWNNANKPNSNILIIFDDVISEMKKAQNDPRLTQLFFNRRKLISEGTISCIITSQKYRMLPPSLRSNLTWLIIFKQSGNDLEAITKENLISIKKANKFQTDIICHHLNGSSTKDQHNFVYLNLASGQIIMNFDRMLTL
jgi:hypothetical protein